jgi:hypothetical protein
MSKSTKTNPKKSAEEKADGPNDTKIYSVLSPHNYVQRGQEKTAWTEVGIAFSSKDGEGVNISIKPGLSVSGRLVLKLWQNKEEQADHEPRSFVYDVSIPREQLI